MYPIFTDNKQNESSTIVYVESIEEAYKQENFTKMFWFIPSSVNLDPTFKFVYQPNPWDTDRVHVFKNKTYHDGILLVPRSVKISSDNVKEYEFTKPVYMDTHASTPVYYDAFTITSYEDYLKALEVSNTDLFWIMPKGVKLPKVFKFSLHFPGASNNNLKINHSFTFNEEHVDVVLASKHSILTKEEVEKFSPTYSRVHDTLGDGFLDKSYKYDVVFISYQEPNADENYKKLLEKAPHAKRIHGVKGIHQAHIEAAKLCTTDMFWVVDGDAEIVDDFNFDLVLDHWPLDIVYVWRSINPINKLVYGYGGIKLLPRKYTLEVDVNQPDMTTSIGNELRPVPEISNVTAFNTDPFNTWKSAFRECAKLASKTIREQLNDETEERLTTWCTVGEDARYGQYSISGSICGRDFGYDNRNMPDKLKLINNFEWLYEQFQRHTVE